jgi:hypothetical protein
VFQEKFVILIPNNPNTLVKSPSKRTWFPIIALSTLHCWCAHASESNCFLITLPVTWLPFPKETFGFR